MEEKQDFSQAGRDYRDSHLYEDALRCFRTAGDEEGIARVYERQNRLQEALAIWKKRGNRKEEARLQKKLDKGKTARSQLALFKEG